MITVRSSRLLSSTSIRRCIATTVEEVISSTDIFSSDLPHITEIPKKPNYVRDLNRFNRANFLIDTKDLHASPKFKLESSSNVSLVKIDYYLETDNIHHALVEIDRLIFETPELVKSIQNMNSIFIKANSLLRVSSKPFYSRDIELNVLNNSVLKLIKLYDFLILESLLNDIIVENTVKVLLRNNRVIQAFNILNAYPDHFKNINLLNLLIKISGDGVPITWTFPTGKHLIKGGNKSIYQALKSDPSKCMSIVKDSALSPNLETLNNMILIIGKSKSLKLLEEFINTTWGINDGKYLPKNSALYPDLTTLINVVYSFGYNDNFVEGLNVLNVFVKNYHFNFNDNEFWCNLFRAYSVSLPKSDFKLEMYKSLWDLTKAYNLNISLELYSMRCKNLKEFFQLRQLIETVPEIYKIVSDGDPVYGQIVLKQYLATIIKLQAQKNFFNQSLKLVETWSPNHQFKLRMDEIVKKNYQYYYKNIEKRMASQNMETNLVYDEDDDDPLIFF